MKPTKTEINEQTQNDLDPSSMDQQSLFAAYLSRPNVVQHFALNLEGAEKDAKKNLFRCFIGLPQSYQYIALSEDLSFLLSPNTLRACLQDPKYYFTWLECVIAHAIDTLFDEKIELNSHLSALSKLKEENAKKQLLYGYIAGFVIEAISANTNLDDHEKSILVKPIFNRLKQVEPSSLNDFVSSANKRLQMFASDEKLHDAMRTRAASVLFKRSVKALETVINDEDFQHNSVGAAPILVEAKKAYKSFAKESDASSILELNDCLAKTRAVIMVNDRTKQNDYFKAVDNLKDDIRWARVKNAMAIFGGLLMIGVFAAIGVASHGFALPIAIKGIEFGVHLVIGGAMALTVGASVSIGRGTIGLFSTHEKKALAEKMDNFAKQHDFKSSPKA